MAPPPKKLKNQFANLDPGIKEKLERQRQHHQSRRERSERRESEHARSGQRTSSQNAAESEGSATVRSTAQGSDVAIKQEQTPSERPVVQSSGVATKREQTKNESPNVQTSGQVVADENTIASLRGLHRFAYMQGTVLARYPREGINRVISENERMPFGPKIKDEPGLSPEQTTSEQVVEPEESNLPPAAQDENTGNDLELTAEEEAVSSVQMSGDGTAAKSHVRMRRVVDLEEEDISSPDQIAPTEFEGDKSPAYARKRGQQNELEEGSLSSDFDASLKKVTYPFRTVVSSEDSPPYIPRTANNGQELSDDDEEEIRVGYKPRLKLQCARKTASERTKKVAERQEHIKTKEAERKRKGKLELDPKPKTTILKKGLSRKKSSTRKSVLSRQEHLARMIAKRGTARDISSDDDTRDERPLPRQRGQNKTTRKNLGPTKHVLPGSLLDVSPNLDTSPDQSMEDRKRNPTKRTARKSKRKSKDTSDGDDEMDEDYCSSESRGDFSYAEIAPPVEKNRKANKYEHLKPHVPYRQRDELRGLGMEVSDERLLNSPSAKRTTSVAKSTAHEKEKRALKTHQPDVSRRQNPIAALQPKKPRWEPVYRKGGMWVVDLGVHPQHGEFPTYIQLLQSVKDFVPSLYGATGLTDPREFERQYLLHDKYLMLKGGNDRPPQRFMAPQIGKILSIYVRKHLRSLGYKPGELIDAACDAHIIVKACIAIYVSLSSYVGKAKETDDMAMKSKASGLFESFVNLTSSHKDLICRTMCMEVDGIADKKLF